eukprot:CAMPEP_0194360156 /NCGR_PEP_ID=MMETSP0174-20130528/7426_1 /TAXON_ID=216777 /ORGANISM="Proboscia alata, Strain PI-D3" /LENGTH=553 /DNA_ID=CAMNT_0039131455 /DNA_START=206 /DNA_END=1867 /DNA_ORIENTATION=+
MAFWETKTAEVDVDDTPLNINDLNVNTINDDDDATQDVDLIPAPPAISSMAVVRRDLPLYTGVLALGILPFINYATLLSILDLDPKTLFLCSSIIRTLYFSVLAILTVYLGAQRQDIGMTQAPVGTKNAIVAPIFAGVTLGLLYALIKYTDLDPGTLYRVFASLFGFICFGEILQPVIGLSPLGGSLVEVMEGQNGEEVEVETADDEERLPEGMTTPTIGESQSDTQKFRAASLPAAILALICVALYLITVASPSLTQSLPTLRTVATTNNYLANSIALASLGQIAIESYVAGALLLIGLFAYDALSVFKSDAMLTVATQIEAPVKLLFSGVQLPVEGNYPFAVLGLGDILVPGIFVAMLRQWDVDRYWEANRESLLPSPIVEVEEEKEKPLFDLSALTNFFNTNPEPVVAETPVTSTAVEVIVDDDGPSLDLFADAPTPYFNTGLIGYTVGLAATFLVLFSTGKGQPALFYIVPSLLISSLGTAAYRGEMSELIGFKGARARDAGIAQEAAKEERERAKELAQELEDEEMVAGFAAFNERKAESKRSKEEQE